MTLRPEVRLRLAAQGGTDPLADAGPDSMTRQAGVAGAGPGCGPGSATAAPTDLTVRILATTDLHANVLSYDYAAHRPLFGQGLAQTASLISAARAEVPDAFLFDNGDFLQGSALADLAARARRTKPHPVIQALNALRYDAVTLGNHEFNFGLDVLQRAIADAQFPVVSANVLRRRADHPLGDDTLAPPYALVDRQLTGPDGRRHRLRLGVLGLTPPEILRWDREHLGNRLHTRPMVEAARAWVPEMRRAGADLVLCLAHTGIGHPGGGVDAEGQATEIAEIDGIDLLIAGHSHLVFPFRGLHPDPRVNPAEGAAGRQACGAAGPLGQPPGDHGPVAARRGRALAAAPGPGARGQRVGRDRRDARRHDPPQRRGAAPGGGRRPPRRAGLDTQGQSAPRGLRCRPAWRRWPTCRPCAWWPAPRSTMSAAPWPAPRTRACRS
jgi:hypothetical protein